MTDFQIDGYTPADPHMATEVGVELNYSTEVGPNVIDFNFRARSTGNENKAFQKAAEKLSNIRDVRQKTGFKQPVIDALKETLEIWYDHVIISWNTTVTQGGKPIENTRENFISLFSHKDQIFIGVFNMLSSDCADVSNFTKEVEAEAVKN